MTLHTWKETVKPDSLTFILATAFLARLVIIPLLYDDYNYWAFGAFSNFLLSGNDPYHIVINDPTLLNINPWRYPPLYLAFTAPALAAKTLTGSSLVYLATLKIPLAVADIISAFYVYKILLLKFPQSRALKYTAIYAFNPLVIFESAGGGFNDPIPITFTVAAFYYFILYKQGKNESTKRNLVTSALLLGLGVAAKIYPLLLLPVFVREIGTSTSRAAYSIASLLPMAMVSTPFLVSDPTSYLSLLIVRSVGGQHPLFPFANISGLLGPLSLATLLLVLAWTFLIRVGLLSRIALVFLWINIAIFAQSLNYMIWGIPFFTILAADNYRMWGSTLTAALTFVTALIFQGWYNGNAGETGLYYWSDHLLHQQVVFFRSYPLSSIDPVILVTTLLLASVALNVFFFFRAVRGKSIQPASSPQQELAGRSRAKGPSRARLVLLGSLCILIIFSWTGTALYANFEPHEYPFVNGTSFHFTDTFHTATLDYQWAFGGRGNYSINPLQGYLDLSDSNSSTGYVYRGWQDTVNGFHQSASWMINLSFRFRALLPGRTGSILANMTDGLLTVQRNQTSEYVQYSDSIHNTRVVFSNIDTKWHNFTESYSRRIRTVQLDGSTRQLNDGNFSKLVLGNYNQGAYFGGRSEYTNVTVIANEFPVGIQSTSLGWATLSLSFSIILLAVLAPNRRFMNLLRGVVFHSRQKKTI